MAKKPTRTDIKKRIAKYDAELEATRKRKADLEQKEQELLIKKKEAEADYVIMLLKETDVSVSLLEDILIQDEKVGDN